MSYSEIRDPQAYDAAHALARGCYQRAVLAGSEALSGATLRGRARSYGARYAASRQALLGRVRAAGIACTVERRAHGKLVLVIGRVDPSSIADLIGC